MPLLHWWLQTDALTQGVALSLLGMSIASWVVIAYKARLLVRARHDVPCCIAAFWQALELSQAAQQVRSWDRDMLVSPLVEAARATISTTTGTGVSTLQGEKSPLATQGPHEQQLTRALRDALHGVVARLQWGQVLLATVGSTAPFLGLLGTVWGIYHALTALAGSQTVSIEHLAAPVGEALVMTAAGLAVAIPAVLAYNWHGRSVAYLENELEGLAWDVRALLLKG